MIALAPTSESWLRAACADLPTLLVDHAHCEKKAAHTAVRFLFRYPEWPRLVKELPKLAREELVHFEQVVRELERRGLALRRLPSANYAAELFRACSDEIDELLACALIEARSHERFVRLAGFVDDAELRDLYQELARAEERHGEIYVELAADRAGRDVLQKLTALTARESEILARPNQPLRMHAGGC